MASLAASTACAVPRRSRCTAISALGISSSTAAVSTSALGPTTTAVAPPTSRTAASTWAISGAPPIACNTLGREDRIRTPSPAARTMERQVRVIGSVALLYGYCNESALLAHRPPSQLDHRDRLPGARLCALSAVLRNPEHRHRARVRRRAWNIDLRHSQGGLYVRCAFRVRLDRIWRRPHQPRAALRNH